MSELIEKSLKYIWYPCSQMKDYETFKPLEIVRSQGSYFYLKDGKKILDSISSWWCKTLGHQHPRLKQALQIQIDKFEHVIFANTTNEIIVDLSERLMKLTPSLNKVFYASEGSSAVEIAMKMSLQTRMIQNDPQRKQFIALENGYHGETLGALSVSDVGIYRKPFASILFPAHFIKSLPYVNHDKHALWENCESHWQAIEEQLTPLAETTTAIIFEPIIQGSGGMKIYSQDLLKRLQTWARANNIHLIADEIMTGLGRTGKYLAVDHANIEPDFICLSKGLTSGWLPMSAVLTSQSIYDLFYDDYEQGKAFLHSHTHSGNVLAASIAVEVLKIIEEEQLCQKALKLGKIMYEYMNDIAIMTRKLTNVRSIGAIVAADLVGSASQRLGYEIYRKAVALGVLLRPLGNTIYWLPPLTIEIEDLNFLRDSTFEAIQSL